MDNKPHTDIGIWYSTWYAKTTDFSKSNRENTWTAWNIAVEPLLPDGSFGTYDSIDPNIISFHLELMAEIGIDFIIMDQTNNIDVDGGYINARSLMTAKVLKEYNDSPEHTHKLRYCSAIGGIQWTRDYATIEKEAKLLYERYIQSDFGSSDYHYTVDGKPLLVVYAGNSGDADGWANYAGDKTYSSRFTLGWANNASEAGCYGWAFDKGTKWHPETVVVMPGWDNRKGAKPVPRDGGRWYDQSWQVVLDADRSPERIVINSFNEYAECTAIFPALTENYPNMPYTNPKGDLDPYYYWNLTREYIRRFKAKFGE